MAGDNKKIIAVVFILIIAQGVSAGLCWLMFEECFVIPTLIGSILPAIVYLKAVK